MGNDRASHVDLSSDRKQDAERGYPEKPAIAAPALPRRIIAVRRQVEQCELRKTLELVQQPSRLWQVRQRIPGPARDLKTVLEPTVIPIEPRCEIIARSQRVPPRLVH